jgi:hypothetical protein
VTALPDRLDRKRHVELENRHFETWLPRVGVVVFAVFLAFGLASVFGQKVETTTAEAASADLEVKAPNAARPGLVYEVQFTITAKEALAQPALVLDSGWFDGFTINTMSPDQTSWIQRDGRNVLSYPSIAAGDELVVRFQYSVNPTTFGRRSHRVVLQDGGSPIASVDHDLTVFP